MGLIDDQERHLLEQVKPVDQGHHHGNLDLRAWIFRVAGGDYAKGNPGFVQRVAGLLDELHPMHEDDDTLAELDRFLRGVHEQNCLAAGTRRLIADASRPRL